MNAPLPLTDQVRIVIRQNGFRVKLLATHFGLDVRTLERRFRDQLGATPKAWLTNERMKLVPPLLAAGLSNKQVAASLHYLANQISAATSNVITDGRHSNSSTFRSTRPSVAFR